VPPPHVRYDLARTIVASLHGADAARQAEEAVRARHRLRASGGADAGNASVPTLSVSPGQDGSVSLPATIVQLGFAPSTSEATRQLKGGGVRINGERVTDIRWTPPAGDTSYLLAVGAKKIARLEVGPASGTGA
jgi:tyrosyl-tRNA synthetase